MDVDEEIEHLISTGIPSRSIAILLVSIYDHYDIESSTGLTNETKQEYVVKRLRDYRRGYTTGKAI